MTTDLSWFAFIFFFPLLFALTWNRYLKWRDFVAKMEKIPGPKGYPVIGNILAIPKKSADRLEYFHVEMPKKYGPIHKYWFLSRVSVVVSSPSMIETLLSSQKILIKGKFYTRFLLPWLGEGLLIASGSKWKKNRRLLTPAFHFQILASFFDVFNKQADIFCRILKDQIASSPGGKSLELNIFPRVKRCTLDIICETVMGVSIKAQTEDSEYPKAVERFSELSFQKFFSFWSFAPDWMSSRLYAKGRELERHIDFLHNFTSNVIRERRAELKQEGFVNDPPPSNKRRPFLDLLLTDEAMKSGTEFNDTELRNEVDTFMFAGHDTVATAMSWFLYCMATNPDKQELVRKELDDIFGDSDRLCTMEDASKLKYLECCIKETLRLYPSVPNIERYIGEEIELGGYRIPAGVTITIQLYALHRNEESFPDPLAFKPERFLVNEGVRNPFAFVPFSGGPRNCIGQRFALFEEKVVLSTLLRQFRFSYDMAKHGPEVPIFDIVLMPQNGLPLIVTPYRRAD